MAFAIFFIAIQSKQTEISITGILHKDVAMPETDEEAAPLAFSLVSAIILLVIAAILIHIIQTRKIHSEKRDSVLRTGA